MPKRKQDNWGPEFKQGYDLGRKDAEEETARMAAVVTAARAFARAWAEFDGEPKCCGEYLNGLFNAVDLYDDLQSGNFRCRDYKAEIVANLEPPK